METKPFSFPLRLNTDGREFVYVAYFENGVEVVEIPDDAPWEAVDSRDDSASN